MSLYAINVKYVYRYMQYWKLHKSACNIHETTFRNQKTTDTHLPKGLEDVCRIFNRDCVQGTVRKRFCYRPRYIPWLLLEIGWSGFAASAITSLGVTLAGDILGIWPHMNICFAQH